MKQTDLIHQTSETLRDWLVPLALALGFLLWGLGIFFAVGVKWPPAWNFGAVPDVPGATKYSSFGRNPLPSVASPFLHEGAELTPQHVRDLPRPETATTPLERQP